MKNKIMLVIGLLVSLTIILATVHADSGQRYEVDTDTMMLRDAPEQEATVIAEMEKGEAITIFEESYGWGKTYYEGQEAWAPIYQLAAVNEGPAEVDGAEASAKDGELYQVQAPAVNVRTSPDVDASILTERNEGEEVAISGESDGWGKTYIDDEEAWIALHLLEEKNDSTDHPESDINEEDDAQLTEEETETESQEVKSDQTEDEEKEADAESDSEDDDNEESTDEDEEQDKQQEQNDEETLSGYDVVIDPGHGGKDTGAIGSETNEKDLTLATAKEVEEQLQDQGASVLLTRADDTFIPLGERAQISNDHDADAFISLHYNASEDPSFQGIQTFYDGSDENRELAGSIQASLISHVHFQDRGVDQADYQVLRDNTQPSILVELGFISNPEEREHIQTDNYQEKAATGIVSGVENYFHS